MAISAREMTIILKAQNEMSKEIERINRELEGMKGASTKAKDEVDDMTKALMKAGGAVTVIKQLAGELKNLGEEILNYAKAYGEAEQAERRLEIAARQNPYMNKQSAENLKDYASQLKQISIYDDDQITQQAAILSAMGLTEKQIKNVLKASVDLASSGMMSLEQATESLGKTYAGTAGTLGRSIPAVTGLTEAELKAGKAIDIVAQSFSGMAEEMTRTTTGAIAVAERGWGDFGETIGKIITQVPLLTEVTVGFVNMVKTIEPLATSAAAIWQMRDAIQGLGVALSTKLLPSLVAIATNPVFLAIAAGTLAVGAVVGIGQAIDSSYTNKLNTDSAFREKEILNDLITLQNEKNMLDESEEVVTARIASNYGVNLDVLREIARTHNLNLESLNQQKTVLENTRYPTPPQGGGSYMGSSETVPATPATAPAQNKDIYINPALQKTFDGFSASIAKLAEQLTKESQTEWEKRQISGVKKEVENVIAVATKELSSGRTTDEEFNKAVVKAIEQGRTSLQNVRYPDEYKGVAGKSPWVIGSSWEPSYQNTFKEREKNAQQMVTQYEQMKKSDEAAKKQQEKEQQQLQAQADKDQQDAKNKTAEAIALAKKYTDEINRMTLSSIEYLKYQKEQELAEAKKYGDEAVKLATEYWDKRIAIEEIKQSKEQEAINKSSGYTFPAMPGGAIKSYTEASRNPYNSWMKEAFSAQAKEGKNMASIWRWMGNVLTKEWLPAVGKWWDELVIGAENEWRETTKEDGNTYMEQVPVGGWDVSAGAEGVANTIGNIGGTIANGIGDALQVSGLSDLFKALGEVLGPIISSFVTMVMSLKSVNAIINWSATIASAMLQVLGPLIDTALKPVVGLLVALAKIVAEALIPILTALTPIIEGLTNFIVWVWNNILRHVFNGLMLIFVTAFNVIMEVLDTITFWDDTFTSKDYAVYKEAGKIVMTKAEAGATGGTSVYGSADDYYNGVEGGGSSGGGTSSPAQYTEGRTINVTINYQDAVYVAGGKQGLDELAELIKAKIIEVEALGL